MGTAWVPPLCRLCPDRSPRSRRVTVTPQTLPVTPECYTRAGKSVSRPTPPTATCHPGPSRHTPHPQCRRATVWTGAQPRGREAGPTSAVSAAPRRGPLGNEGPQPSTAPLTKPLAGSTHFLSHPPWIGGCGAVSGRPQHHSRGTWAPRLPSWGCPGSRPPSMAWSPARPSRRASAGWPGSRSLGEELTFGKMTSQAPHQHELVPGSVAWWPEASRDLAATLLLGLTSPRQMGSCAPSPPLGGPPTPRRGEAPTAPLSLPPHASFIVYHVLGSGTHQVLTQQVTRHRNRAHGTHTGLPNT